LIHLEFTPQVETNQSINQNQNNDNTAIEVLSLHNPDMIKEISEKQVTENFKKKITTFIKEITRIAVGKKPKYNLKFFFFNNKLYSPSCTK
jgi:hypothetical protein